MPRGPKGERRPADVIGAAVKHHQALALRTFGTFDYNWRNAGMLRLGFRHDASLKQAGAQNSLSPVEAEGWAGDGTSMLFRMPKFRVRKIKGPERGGKLRPGQFGVTVYQVRSLGMTKLSQCVEFANGPVRPGLQSRWGGKAPGSTGPPIVPEPSISTRNVKVKSPWVVCDDCAVLSTSASTSVTGRTWSFAFPSQTGTPWSYTR